MRFKKSSRYNSKADVVLFRGDCLDLLKDIPNESVQLIITSPPYNLGKEYEEKLTIKKYVEFQAEVIEACARVLYPRGSMCWEVANIVARNGEIFPIDSLLLPFFWDVGLHLRNRIIWHFGHGLHCRKRFSHRYETINWFTKSDDYVFNLDSVRVPQRYPSKKHFKGLKRGQYSCNPLGANPGDVWEFPNVKSNHREKTSHPCQFPIELAERLVLGFSNEGDIVFDPFVGSGTTLVAALKNGRKTIGAEKIKEYVEISKERIKALEDGTLKIRPWGPPIYNTQSSRKPDGGSA